MRIRFKRDTSFRKPFFVPDSFAHPAKMDAQLLIWIVEHYTGAGETILDPMAGSGTTMLACTLGRNCILIELEYKFCMMMWDDWYRVQMRPQLGSTMGSCKIILGDARNLKGVLYGDCSGPVNHIDSVVSGKDFNKVDKIVTSPPYAEAMEGGTRHHIRTNGTEYELAKEKKMGSYYSDAEDNIGNLKSDSYLEAMLQVYQQCFSVLKNGGLLILVTKNFIRNKQVVRLDKDTIKLCEQAGFSFVERHYRELPSQSFWRVIYHQKFPDVEQIKSEDVLIFRK